MLPKMQKTWEDFGIEQKTNINEEKQSRMQAQSSEKHQKTYLELCIKENINRWTQ